MPIYVKKVETTEYSMTLDREDVIAALSASDDPLPPDLDSKTEVELALLLRKAVVDTADYEVCEYTTELIGKHGVDHAHDQWEVIEPS